MQPGRIVMELLPDTEQERGEFTLTEGTELQILVGQLPQNHNNGAGGVELVTQSPHSAEGDILIIAGGGGPAYGLSGRNTSSDATTSTTGSSTGCQGASGGNGGPTCGYNGQTSCAGQGGGFFTNGGETDCAAITATMSLKPMSTVVPAALAVMNPTVVLAVVEVPVVTAVVLEEASLVEEALMPATLTVEVVPIHGRLPEQQHGIWL